MYDKQYKQYEQYERYMFSHKRPYVQTETKFYNY